MKIPTNTYHTDKKDKTFLSFMFVIALLLVPAVTFADNDKDNKGNTHDKHVKAEVSVSAKQGWNWNWGIFKKWPFTPGNNPKPADTVAPVINSFAVYPQITRADVTWSTNENTRAVVFYGTTSPVVVKSSATSTGAMSASVSSSNSASVTDTTNKKLRGSITLKNLSASTTYYAVLAVRDRSGNVTVSNVVTFTTKGIVSKDTKAPVISNIITTIKSATILGISWMTDEPATSQVFYGTSTINVNSSTTPRVSSGSLNTTHAFDIPVLSTTTPEHFVIQSIDAQGNVRTSAEYSVLLPF